MRVESLHACIDNGDPEGTLGTVVTGMAEGQDRALHAYHAIAVDMFTRQWLLPAVFQGQIQDPMGLVRTGVTVGLPRSCRGI